MKRSAANLFAIALIFALIVSFLPAQPARAATTTITQWTFESPNTPAAATAAVYPNPIAPAVGSGNAGGIHTSASTAWSTPAGNGSAISFSSNNWAVGDYYQFSTITSGYTGISVAWDQTSSGTGPRDFKIAYSTDGTNFTDFGSYTVLANASPNAWSSTSPVPAANISRDLSAITALDNQANVYFRLVDTSTTSANGGAVASGGTDRVDNFTVSGTALPVDLPPSVASSTPDNGATNVALNSNIIIIFSEAVNVTSSWFSLSCATSGVHSAVVSGGPTSFTLDSDTDFVNSEMCTLTVFAANVSDQDLVDPPDSMLADFTASFTTVPPTPTNPFGTGAASPASVPAGGSSLLTMTVTPGANPSSSSLGVSCDLTGIGGSNPQVFYDNGTTGGDLVASDNIFSFFATVDANTSIGSKSLHCTISDGEGRSGSASIPLNVLLPADSVVISQVYGGGGNTGATFTNDFIELYNRTANPIDLTGWSVQYGSSGGTSFSGKTVLSGLIQPGHYYLIQEAAGAGGTINLPTPDVIGTIAMSGTAAKVALVFNSTTLTGACPTGFNISDFVGYGGANCYEGSPTPVLSNTTAAIRNGNGSIDTNNNAVDFTVGAPNPRNSMYPFTAVGFATPTTFLPGTPSLLTVKVNPGVDPASTGIGVVCDLSGIGGSDTQTLYDDASNGDVTAGDLIFSYLITDTVAGTQYVSCTFSDAQGRSDHTSISMTLLTVLPIGTVNGVVLDTDNPLTHASSYVGQTVLVQGVIYETTLQAISNSTNTYKGFYIQNTATTRDGLANTSDGLFVFLNTSSTITGGYTPTVGDEVVISGTISEYFNMTELTSPALMVPVIRSGVDAEIAPVVANPPVSLADANRYWERLQGMRVQVPTGSITLGGRNVFSPADAEIWLARPDSTIAQRANVYAQKAYRDAHPLDDNYDAANWDGNGYRILIGSLGIKAAAGDSQALIGPERSYSTLTNASTGGLNYTFSKYRIEVETQPTFSEGVDPATNNPPTVFDRSIHYSISDYNLENLYDYRDNPFSGCDFTGDTGCPKVDPFLAAVTPPYDYVPASDAAYQARLNDIALQIINNLHSPDVLMVQEVENQDICTVTGSALTCGTSDNADGKPDVLQELALKVAANGGPAYDAAFDRDSSDLRGIAPAFLYRTERVQLLNPSGDPVLGGNPAIGSYTSVPYDGDVSNPKTLNAVYTGTGACETNWVFPRAPDVGLFRIFSNSIGVGSYRDVYVIDNHFKSGPDTCVAHRTEQAKYNAALVAYIQGTNPDARIVVGGDLNVYPRPDDPFAPIGQTASSDQLGSLYDPSLGLKNLWEVLLGQAPEAAYSYVYLGMAQTLDQMFINQPMLTDLTQFRIAHINSDFAADYPDDVARGTSDHDPNLASFVINDPPSVNAGGPYSVNEGSPVTLTATGTDPEGQPLTYAWDLDNNGTYETPGQSVSFTGVDGPATLTVNVEVTDNGGLTATASTTVTVINVPPIVNAPVVSPEPSTEGSSVTASATFSDPGVNDAPFTCTVNYGDGSDDLAGTVSGNTCTGPAHVYAAFGSYPVTISVTDKDGGIGSNSSTHNVIFNWSGFFSPIDNLPAWNSNKAGSAVPVKFSLGGNKGLNIFAAGFPQSVQIACDTGTVIGSPVATENPGGSRMSFGGGQYNYVWKTEKSWGGTCRQLVVKLIDGTFHYAKFNFK